MDYYERNKLCYAQIERVIDEAAKNNLTLSKNSLYAEIFLKFGFKKKVIDEILDLFINRKRIKINDDLIEVM